VLFLTFRSQLDPVLENDSLTNRQMRLAWFMDFCPIPLRKWQDGK